MNNNRSRLTSSSSTFGPASAAASTSQRNSNNAMPRLPEYLHGSYLDRRQQQRTGSNPARGGGRGGRRRGDGPNDDSSVTTGGGGGRGGAGRRRAAVATEARGGGSRRRTVRGGAFMAIDGDDGDEGDDNSDLDVDDDEDEDNDANNDEDEDEIDIGLGEDDALGSSAAGMLLAGTVAGPRGVVVASRRIPTADVEPEEEKQHPPPKFVSVPPAVFFEAEAAAAAAAAAQKERSATMGSLGLSASNSSSSSASARVGASSSSSSAASSSSPYSSLPSSAATAVRGPKAVPQAWRADRNAVMGPTTATISSSSSSAPSVASSSATTATLTSTHQLAAAPPPPPPLPPAVPLPTAWVLDDFSKKDNHAMLLISKKGLRVTYSGPGTSDIHAASLRSNHPVPREAGIYYFEVTVISKGANGYIGIGLCESTVDLNRLPGWDTKSWGYHGDDGNMFAASQRGQPFGPTYTTGDVIGCRINFRDMTVSFTKNGIDIGVAFKDIPRDSVLYPTVGMRTRGEILEANFGASPFRYDIATFVADERMSLRQSIEASVVLRLPPRSSAPSATASKKEGAASAESTAVTTTAAAAAAANAAIMSAAAALVSASMGGGGEASSDLQQQPPPAPAAADAAALEESNATSPSSLKRQRAPSAEESIIHPLILKYLTHSGYLGTAEVFKRTVVDKWVPDGVYDIDGYVASRARKRRPASRISCSDSMDVDVDDVRITDGAPPPATTANNGASDSMMDGDVDDDDDEGIEGGAAMRIRHRIRRSLLAGDVPTVMGLLQTHQPQLLDRNPHLRFALMCQEFLELIASSCKSAGDGVASAEGRVTINGTAGHAAGKRPVAGGGGGVRDDGGNDDDDDGDDGDDDDDDDCAAAEWEIKALALGTGIARRYPSQTYSALRPALDEVFSFMAYPDPRSAPTAHLLHPSVREHVATLLDKEVLAAVGEEKETRIEALVRQAVAVVEGVQALGMGLVDVWRDCLH